MARPVNSYLCARAKEVCMTWKHNSLTSKCPSTENIRWLHQCMIQSISSALSEQIKWLLFALFLIIHLNVNTSSPAVNPLMSDHEEQTDNPSALWFVADAKQRGVLKPHVSSSVFGLFVEGEVNCALDPLQLHTLTSCGFNSSNPLIIITHGWSVRSTFLPLHWLEPLDTKHGAVRGELLQAPFQNLYID